MSEPLSVVFVSTESITGTSFGVNLGSLMIFQPRFSVAAISSSGRKNALDGEDDQGESGHRNKQRHARSERVDHGSEELHREQDGKNEQRSCENSRGGLVHLHSLGFVCYTSYMNTSGNDIAWAAGLFEGEGTFELRNRKSGRSITGLRLGMTDLDVVERFHKVVGVGKIRTVQRPDPNHKTLYQWSVHRMSEMEPIIVAFLPYLGKRRSIAARAALEYIREPFRKGVYQLVVGGTCKRGHVLTEDRIGTYYDKKTGKTIRSCKDCKVLHRRAYVARQALEQR